MPDYHTLVDFIPTWGEFLTAFLSAAIPMIVYYVNQTLHKIGDPPWKKHEYGAGRDRTIKSDGSSGSISSGGSKGPHSSRR